MAKKPDHPSMQGKSNEEILADAKPFVDEIKHHAEDDTFKLYVGDKIYTGKELCDELLNLTPFGRELISNWHYGNSAIAAYEIKRKIARARRSTENRSAFVVVTFLIAVIVTINFRPQDGWQGFCILIGAVALFGGTVIFFQKRCKKLSELESMLTGHE